MTTARFTWQQKVVSQFPGRVLNVGSNEDPSRLKETFGKRVINVDIEANDSALKRPNNYDILFDATKEIWPYDNDSVNLVVLGDVVEHWLPESAEAAFKEARRVSLHLAITVPNDNRHEIEQEVAPDDNPYIYHQHTVTEKYLRNLLDKTGWEVIAWETVDYGFVSEGYFVVAQRKD